MSPTTPVLAPLGAGTSGILGRRTQPTARLRLVCFPHSGGGSGVFRRWPRGLAPEIEVLPVAMPGRGVRVDEPFAREWAPLVAEFASAIAEEVSGPVALFGHSLGGLLAYEVARAMTAAGRPPEHLFVSARGTPASGLGLSVPDDDAALLRLVETAYDGVPDVLRDSPEMVRHFMPVLRADLELAAAYTHRPGVLLDCPVTALGGVDDRSVSAAELAGWRHYTMGPFRSQVFRGGHFYLNSQEDALLATVRACFALA